MNIHICYNDIVEHCSTFQDIEKFFEDVRKEKERKGKVIPINEHSPLPHSHLSMSHSCANGTKVIK